MSSQHPSKMRNGVSDAPVTRHSRNRSLHTSRVTEAADEAKEVSSKHQSSDGAKKAKVTQSHGNKAKMISQSSAEEPASGQPQVRSAMIPRELSLSRYRK